MFLRSRVNNLMPLKSSRSGYRVMKTQFLLLTWKKRSIWGWRLTIGSLTGSTSLKQMIVTAAQAIMRHTLTMKKKCRNLSRREHSGNLQWEIWKEKENLVKDQRTVVITFSKCFLKLLWLFLYLKNHFGHFGQKHFLSLGRTDVFQ